MTAAGRAIGMYSSSSSASFESCMGRLLNAVAARAAGPVFSSSIGSKGWVILPPLIESKARCYSLSSKKGLGDSCLSPSGLPLKFPQFFFCSAIAVSRWLSSI